MSPAERLAALELWAVEFLDALDAENEPGIWHVCGQFEDRLRELGVVRNEAG
jgi:hypothetical protein